MGNVISWAAVENLFTGVPVDGLDQIAVSAAPDPPPPPFWARMSAQLSRRPRRLVTACVVSVLGPAVVAHAGSLAPPGAAAAGPAPGPVAVIAAAPKPGDPASWLSAARGAAAACPGLSPSVLVAIGQVETGLGSSAGTSAAGALGPMQFLATTWAAYGVDADGDGVADVLDPVDALHGAARLLCANGGADPDRLPSALWNYNHSDAYVGQVLTAARLVPAAS